MLLDQLPLAVVGAARSFLLVSRRRWLRHSSPQNMPQKEIRFRV
jgi:hypothetical protein